jgi:pentatricopeptide repeat protein
VTWNTLMNAYAAAGNAAKCEELMTRMQAAPHCIAPNVTTWSTLMKSYYQRSRDSSAGDGCFSVFQRMVSARVAPDSVSLATLFAALMYGFRGDRAAGAAKVIELSKQWVDTRTLNHHVAGGVLRALAAAGTAADVEKFWSFCSAQLGRSRQGWPGSSFKILSDLSQKLSGKGQWSRIAALLAASAPRTSSGAAKQSSR